MMANAAADIRAMEMKIQSLQEQVKTSEEDNERLRTLYAKTEIEKAHAKADLIHYQNLFEANVVIEAMTICKEMFKTVHENVHAKASEAVQRMIEERVEKEREESATKVASDIDEDSFLEPKPSNEQAPAANTPMPKDGAIVQAPKGQQLKETKLFYRQRIGFVPSNYSQLPIYQYNAELNKWFQQGVFKDNGEPIPQFLHTREPREDLRGNIP